MDHLDLVKIADSISASELVDFVKDPSTGGISVFVGTTRDSFTVDGETKQVLHLEYEAYIPMAVKKMQELSVRVRDHYPVVKVAIVHRLGRVDVMEESIGVAASSAHRKEAIDAVTWLVDELKAQVPIWKKEIYSDGSQWKENTKICCKP